MSQKFKRRNYFIKKDFQGKMILGFFLFVICSIILFTVIFGMLSADSITISYKDNNLVFGQTPMMLFKNALAANWVFIIFGGTLLVIGALLISHRIAGPQFRFEKTLTSMIDGKLNDTIHLRTHDVGVALAILINSFNSQLSRDIRDIDKNTQSIDELIMLLEQADPASLDKKALLETSNSIREHSNSIRKVTTSFTLADE